MTNQPTPSAKEKHWLTYWREKNGYTKQEAAKWVGCSRQYVTRIERGEADVPLQKAYWMAANQLCLIDELITKDY